MRVKYGIQVYNFDGTYLREIPVGDKIIGLVIKINQLESQDNGLSYKMIKHLND